MALGYYFHRFWVACQALDEETRHRISAGETTEKEWRESPLFTAAYAAWCDVNRY